MTNVPVEGLGRHLMTYPTLSRTEKTGKPAVVFAVLGAVLTLLGLLAGGPGGTVLMFIGVPFLLVAAAGLIRAKQVDSGNAGQELHIFDHGLAITGPTSRLENVFRWDSMTVNQDVVNYRLAGMDSGTTYTYTLTRPDGPAARIGRAFAHPEQWGPHLQDAVTRAQLPGVLAAVQAGRSVTFAYLEVHRDVLRAGRSEVEWARVDKPEFEQGYLTIRAAGRRTALVHDRVSSIPNVHVLAAVVEHLRTTA